MRGCRCPSFLGAVVLFGLAVAMSTSMAATRHVGPDQDWCFAANALAPGEELRLAPGEYVGSCTLASGGKAGAPIVVRAADPAARPTLSAAGAIDNLINVTGGHVTLRELKFGPTPADVDAVRIRAGDGVTVEDCDFQQVGGIAVASNNVSTRGLTITRNEIAASRATAIYVGCHDGAQCQATDVVIEGNYIHGVDAPAGQVGYGVQLKLNSSAIIRGNVVVDTKGPGIMIYGARTRDVGSVLEQNLVMNSRTSAGIVLGGGPASVSNNIVVGGKAGIALEDYASRGLLRGILVAHNTVYGVFGGGLSTPLLGRLEAELSYNASHSVAGPALPAPRPGLRSFGNVDCRLSACFVEPLMLKFGPRPGSLLVARSPVGGHTPAVDYFGLPRPPLAAVGAVDESGRDGVLMLGKKPR